MDSSPQSQTWEWSPTAWWARTHSRWWCWCDDPCWNYCWRHLAFSDPETRLLGLKVLKITRAKPVELVCVCGCSGWVPVEKNNKQYCWHSSVVDHNMGKALVLRPSADDADSLEIAAVPLGDLLEQTLELIGTNVNGNPYGNVRLVNNLCIIYLRKVHSLEKRAILITGREQRNVHTAWQRLVFLTELGCKRQPVHCLVSHGSVGVRDPPPVDFQQLRLWFQDNPEGRVEGIVWHCNDGTLIKVRQVWPERTGAAPAAAEVLLLFRCIDITWAWAGRMGTRVWATGHWWCTSTPRWMNTAAARTCSPAFPG